MILGIDSSAITAGCALYDGEKIIAEQFMNTAHTHSETLLPMVSDMLKNARLTLADVDRIAVTAGPGSFTGLRIGVSCVKGLCDASGKPCVSVSTLEAAAYNFTGFDCVVCACMDARRQQFYNALFRSENGVITRLCDDRAIAFEDLLSELSGIDGKIFIAGDGAELFDRLSKNMFTLAPYELRYQRGSGVCKAAADKPVIEAAALMPTYLRIPQAERNRLQTTDQR